MYFDGINNAFSYLVKDVYTNGIESKPRNLKIREKICQKIEIANPNKRYVKNNKYRQTDLFYAFGEMFWYLSKTNSLDFIKYYSPSIGRFSDDGATLNSAYGYLMFEKFGNQFEKCYKILKEDKDSRQAVIFLRNPNDLFLKTKDQVCTCFLQFFIRDNKLILVTTMRSNDLMVGFLYDVFCFTMFQEIMANKLQVELGSYYHITNSLHIYEDWFSVAEKISKKYFKKIEVGQYNNIEFLSKNIEKEISVCINYEKEIRFEHTIENLFLLSEEIKEDEKISNYWKDVLHLFMLKKIFLLNSFDDNYYMMLDRLKHNLDFVSFSSYFFYKKGANV